VTEISVYIPAYNVARFLPRSIESVFGQSLAPAEVLVVDDGSTDNSAEIAGSYHTVTVVRHESNRGLAAARNTAFRSARCMPTALPIGLGSPILHRTSVILT